MMDIPKRERKKEKEKGKGKRGSLQRLRPRRVLSRSATFLVELPTNADSKPPGIFVEDHRLPNVNEKKVQDYLVHQRNSKSGVHQENKANSLVHAHLTKTDSLFMAINQTKASLFKEEHMDIFEPERRRSVAVGMEERPKHNDNRIQNSRLLDYPSRNGISSKLKKQLKRKEEESKHQTFSSSAPDIEDMGIPIEQQLKEDKEKKDYKAMASLVSILEEQKETKTKPINLHIHLEEISNASKLTVKKTARDKSSLKGSGVFRKKLSDAAGAYYQIGTIVYLATVLANAIHTGRGISHMNLEQRLRNFTSYMKPLVPLANTLIEDVSPSFIREALWNEKNEATSKRIEGWREKAFLGDARMLGILFGNHAVTIVERLASLLIRGSSLPELHKTFIRSLVESEDDYALENARVFPLNEVVTGVYSGPDTSVLVLESGGLYIIASDIMAGLCVGLKKKIMSWKGTCFITSFRSHHVVKVACGVSHFAALTRTGDVFTWGSNCTLYEGETEPMITGQLGHSLDHTVAPPVAVKILGFAYDVDCGLSHTVILSTAGVYTFGSNSFGELGRGRINCSIGIIPGSEQWKAVQVTCGNQFSLVLSSESKLIGWGNNQFGQIRKSGMGDYISKPYIRDDPYGFVYLAAGATHCLGCTKDGKMYAWGSNFVGELGVVTGRIGNGKTFVSVPGHVTFVTCGTLSSAAIVTSGEVYAWGLLKSQMFVRNQKTPRLLDALNSRGDFIASVSCGSTHMLVMTDIPSTNLLELFRDFCRYESVYKIIKLRKCLLSLSDRGLLMKPIQDRAVRLLRAQPSHSCAFITVNSCHHTFKLSHNSATTYQPLMLTNKSPMKVNVSVHVDGSLSHSSYKIDIIPTHVIIPKGGEIAVNIVLQSLALPPEDEACAIFYFIVQPVSETQECKTENISRYFIMCDIFPPQERTAKSTGNTIIATDLRNSTEAREKSVVILKTYIPTSILHYLVKHPNILTKPYHERFCGSVIFLDVSGFTMLTAQMALLGDVGPEKISKPLNTYFGALIDTVNQFGGELVKSAGDAIMCIFRAPPDDRTELNILALRSVQAGLEIQKKYSSYDTGQGFSLTLHIGIGCGEMNLLFVGGVNNQWMHIVTGEPLKQLSTCVASSNSGELVVSPSTFKLVEELVENEPRDNDFLIHCFKDPSQHKATPLPDVEIPSTAEDVLRCFVHPAIIPSLECDDWQIDELRNLTSVFIKLDCQSFASATSRVYCSSLQEIYVCVQKEILEQEGIICQFLEDDKGIILFAAFGVPPYSHIDDPFRAVKASVRIYHTLEALHIPCSIGITTGFVFVGVIGSDKSHYYTVLGDAVNMAARLMGTAARMQLGLLAGQTTYESCNLRIEFEVLEPVMVKGKNEPLNIYRPRLSPGKEKVNAEAIASNIFGRENQLLLITQKIVQISQHRFPGHPAFQNQKPEQLACIFILEGPPGIGKSFLAEYAINIAEERKMITATGYSKTVHQITPYHPWGGIVQTLLGIKGDATKEQLNIAIRNVKKTIDPSLIPYLPLLQAFLPSFHFSASEKRLISFLGTEERHNYISKIIYHLVEHISCQCGLLLVLENLQWMDIPSFRLLYSIASTVHSVVIVATTRDLTEYQQRQIAVFSLESTIRFPLQPLTNGQCISLLIKHLGIQQLPKDLIPFIPQVQGNPLYCEELAYVVLAKIPDIGSSGLRAKMNNLGIPDSVEGLIGSRLDLQPPSAQNLLKIASVIGVEFDIPLLFAIYDSGKIGSDIKWLKAQKFIVQVTPSSYKFESETTCRVAYSRLLVYKRKEYHQKIAQWYEQCSNATSTEDQETIPLRAYHWYEALHGDEDIDERALNMVIGYMCRSAEIASKFAPEDAAFMIQRALTFVSSIPNSKIKFSYQKKLKLQLMGLPVQNLYNFKMKERANLKSPFNHGTSSPTRLLNRKPKDLSSSNLAPRSPIRDETKEIGLQGSLKQKSWSPLHRTKVAYCVLCSGTFSIYGKANQSKLRDSFPLQIASARVLGDENSNGDNCFAISRRDHSEIILSCESAEEAKHWVTAISVYSEIPSLHINIENFHHAGLIVFSVSGKIQAINSECETLLDLTRAEVIGQTIKVFTDDKELLKLTKSANRDLLRKNKTIELKQKDSDGIPLQIVVCVGEFTVKGTHQFLLCCHRVVPLSEHITFVLEEVQITPKKSYIAGEKPNEWTCF